MKLTPDFVFILSQTAHRLRMCHIKHSVTSHLKHFPGCVHLKNTSLIGDYAVHQVCISCF